MVEVEAKHSVLLRSLEKFYDDEALVVFHDALIGDRKISLRVLDWLVTNYAKKRNIVYPARVNGRDVTFNMYLEYKSQLKAYSKRHFDPFSRRERVWFRDIKTTCGQLNFFKWAMQYGVLDYARDHHDDIERDMLDSIQHRHSAGPTHKSSRRKELSKAAIKTCTTTKVKVVVKFN
jgi:hypothetical protein